MLLRIKKVLIRYEKKTFQWSGLILIKSWNIIWLFNSPPYFYDWLMTSDNTWPQEFSLRLMHFSLQKLTNWVIFLKFKIWNVFISSWHQPCQSNLSFWHSISQKRKKKKEIFKESVHAWNSKAVDNFLSDFNNTNRLNCECINFFCSAHAWLESKSCYNLFKWCSDRMW